MAISPDRKDWTWVLQRPCPECGIDVREVARADIGEMVRANAVAWIAVLESPAPVRERPSPSVWSPLEYACHVRDVFRLFDHRLHLMLTEDDPLYPNWDQDATAEAERYGEQDPGVVGLELHAAATALADDFDRVPTAAWNRTGRRSDGATFTVESFARYLIHDPVHHLHDVRHAGQGSPTLTQQG